MIKIEGADKSFELCQDCVHAYDSTEICILRRCIHAFSELRECYKPKKELKPSAQPETHDKRTETHGVCLDTIDRQLAIDALTRKMVSIPTAGEKDLMGDVNRIRAEDISVIRRLQSAQLEKVDTPTVDTPTCEDAVSRQAAIALIRQRLIETALNNLDNSDVYTDIADNRIEAWIDELPSAQPEPLDEWCTDCKEYDHERHCCPRWNRVIRTTLKDMKKEQPEIIRCKDCKYCDRGIDEDGNPFLKCLGWSYGGTQEEDFCSHAERRTDESD